MTRIEYNHCFEDFKEFNLAHLSPPVGRRFYSVLPWFTFILLEVAVVVYIIVTASPDRSLALTRARVPMSDIVMDLLPWMVLGSGLVLCVLLDRRQWRHWASRRAVYVVPSRLGIHLKSLVLFTTIILFFSLIWFLRSTNSQSGTSLLWSDIAVNLGPYLLLGIFLWLFTAYSQGRRIRNAWEGNPSLQLHTTFEADESGIKFNDTQTQAAQQWSTVRRIVETPNLFCLYLSKTSARMIPKRAFSSPEAVDEFRNLLERHLIVPTGGFPIVTAANTASSARGV